MGLVLLSPAHLSLLARVVEMVSVTFTVVEVLVADGLLTASDGTVGADELVLNHGR